MTQNSAHTGKLYVVGTPIGNLGDLSPRVGEAFAAADVICCEDTRVTSKLLMHLGISKPPRKVTQPDTSLMTFASMLLSFAFG